MPDSTVHRQFMEMLDAHGPALMGMLRRLCGGRHDAEDVFQDAAVRIWRGFAGRPRLRNPRGWVMTIGYRAYLDARARRRGHEEVAELAETPDQRGPPAQEAAEKAEACRNVTAAIAELSEPIREVVVCHYFGGLSLSETASAMKLSQGTVKSRLSAALTRLRSVLE